MNAKNKFNFESDVNLLIPDYLENRKQELKQLRDDFQKRNYFSIETVANRLKGSAGSYGFEELGLLGEELENAAHQQDHHKTNEAIKKIKDFIEKTEKK